MQATGVIARKRDGHELSSEEIAWVVDGFVRGAVSEGQMAALLMAIVLNGMQPREVADLTLCMMRSGEVLDLSDLPGIKVDKHSTGGVGDKTTLVVAPLVAALGVPVPKMSGRALGHTGGTIDKLECLPGLTTQLSTDRFRRQIAEIGVAIAAQSETMVPADKRIYALRDATATVESIPLIAASVMSKKLAVGADALLLDVKAGEGAFMATVAQARELARVMVEIGEHAGKRVVALVTAMDQPLGAAVGDVLELQEAIATLAGDGPPDFVELCALVAGHMLALGGRAADPKEGEELAREGLRTGLGRAKLRALVQAQGGDGAALEHPESLLGEVVDADVVLPTGGFITGIEAREVGLAIRALKVAAGTGGHQCGVLLRRKAGEAVSDEPVASVFAPREAEPHLAAAVRAIGAAYRTGAEAVAAAPLLAEVVLGRAAPA